MREGAFRIYCSFNFDEAGIFKWFCFIKKNVNMMRKVTITISEFTRSVQLPCGRCHNKFIWNLWVSNCVNFLLKNVKTAVQPCKLLKSPRRKPWGGSKEILWIYYFSFLIREVKIRLISFLVFQFVIENLDWGREVYHFMDLIRGRRELIQI